MVSEEVRTKVLSFVERELADPRSAFGCLAVALASIEPLSLEALPPYDAQETGTRLDEVSAGYLRASALLALAKEDLPGIEPGAPRWRIDAHHQLVQQFRHVEVHRRVQSEAAAMPRVIARRDQEGERAYFHRRSAK